MLNKKTFRTVGVNKEVCLMFRGGTFSTVTRETTGSILRKNRYLGCAGTEEHISECKTYYYQNCNGYSDVRISCTGKAE